MNRARITAGVGKISTRGPQAHRSRRIPVGRRAQNLEERAHILAAFNVTPGHVPRVVLWALRSLASVGRIPRRSCAERPTTKMVGAARRFAEIFCPAESTFVRTHVIPDSVEIAISRLRPNVTAGVSRRKSLASSGRMCNLHTV